MWWAVYMHMSTHTTFTYHWPWWCHQMEAFSTLLALCKGNPPVTPALMFSLIWVWANGWANCREAGDLRHRRAHYEVTVMMLGHPAWQSFHNKDNPTYSTFKMLLMYCIREQWHSYITLPQFTHWGWVTHIFVSKLAITGSDNGLSPGRRQAIIWTNAGILLIWPLGTNFSEM